MIEPPRNFLLAKSEDQIRQEMRGFPNSAVEAVMELRTHMDRGSLRKAMLSVLEYYLPKSAGRPGADVPDTTRLREDMAVDSLTLAEAAYKFDELLGVPIETRDTAEIKTVGEMHAFLCSKLGLTDASPARVP
jgi:acyl carrier protein